MAVSGTERDKDVKSLQPRVKEYLHEDDTLVGYIAV
jgi:hypothetical protein